MRRGNSFNGHPLHSDPTPPIFLAFRNCWTDQTPLPVQVAVPEFRTADSVMSTAFISMGNIRHDTSRRVLVSTQDLQCELGWRTCDNNRFVTGDNATQLRTTGSVNYIKKSQSINHIAEHAPSLRIISCCCRVVFRKVLCFLLSQLS